MVKILQKNQKCLRKYICVIAISLLQIGIILTLGDQKSHDHKYKINDKIGNLQRLLLESAFIPALSTPKTSETKQSEITIAATINPNDKITKSTVLKTTTNPIYITKPATARDKKEIEKAGDLQRTGLFQGEKDYDLPYYFNPGIYDENNIEPAIILDNIQDQLTTIIDHAQNNTAVNETTPELTARRIQSFINDISFYEDDQIDVLITNLSKYRNQSKPAFTAKDINSAGYFDARLPVQSWSMVKQLGALIPDVDQQSTQDEIDRVKPVEATNKYNYCKSFDNNQICQCFQNWAQPTTPDGRCNKPNKQMSLWNCLELDASDSSICGMCKEDYVLNINKICFRKRTPKACRFAKEIRDEQTGVITTDCIVCNEGYSARDSSENDTVTDTQYSESTDSTAKIDQKKEVEYNCVKNEINQETAKKNSIGTDPIITNIIPNCLYSTVYKVCYRCMKNYVVSSDLQTCIPIYVYRSSKCQKTDPITTETSNDYTCGIVSGHENPVRCGSEYYQYCDSNDFTCKSELVGDEIYRPRKEDCKNSDPITTEARLSCGTLVFGTKESNNEIFVKCGPSFPFCDAQDNTCKRDKPTDHKVVTNDYSEVTEKCKMVNRDTPRSVIFDFLLKKIGLV